MSLDNYISIAELVVLVPLVIWVVSLLNRLEVDSKEKDRVERSQHMDTQRVLWEIRDLLKVQQQPLQSTAANTSSMLEEIKLAASKLNSSRDPLLDLLNNLPGTGTDVPAYDPEETQADEPEAQAVSVEGIAKPELHSEEE